MVMASDMELAAAAQIERQTRELAALRAENQSLRDWREQATMNCAKRRCATREWSLKDSEAENEALRARVAELEVIAISICAGNCLPPFPCAQDGCPKRASASAGVVPE